MPGNSLPRVAGGRAEPTVAPGRAVDEDVGAVRRRATAEPLGTDRFDDLEQSEGTCDGGNGFGRRCRVPAVYSTVDDLDRQVDRRCLEYPVEAVGDFPLHRGGAKDSEQLVGRSFDVDGGPRPAPRYSGRCSRAIGRPSRRARELVDQRDDLVGGEGRNVDHGLHGNA